MNTTDRPGRCVVPLAVVLIALSLAAIIPVTGQSPAGQSSCAESVICPGEELLYEVSWLGIKLGRIHFITSPTRVVDGSTRYTVSAYIDSYDGLPFVNLHAIDRSIMNERYYSLGFMAFEKNDDLWTVDTCRYDTATGVMITAEWKQADSGRSPETAPVYDTLRLKQQPVQDGLSVLYFTRYIVRENRLLHTTGHGRAPDELRVPTVVYGKEGTTRFTLGKDPEEIDIAVVKHRKLRTIPFEGKAEFKGLFGLSGDFQGWCTDDGASVPLRADLKVLLGSVKVELIWWRRHGWSPP